MPEPLEVTVADDGLYAQVGDESVPVKLPDGAFMRREEVESEWMPRSNVERSIQDRVARAKSSTRKELAQDEDFLSELAQDRADYFRQTLGIEKGPDVEKLKESIQERVATPLQERIESLQAENEGLRGRSFTAGFRTAIAGRLEDEASADLLEEYAKGKMRWSPEHRDFFVVDPDNPDEFLLSAEQKRGKAPYMGVEEFITGPMAEKFKHLFRDRQRSGAGVRIDGDGRTSGEMTLERFEKMTPAQRTQLFQEDATTYRQMMAKVREKGEASMAGSFSI